MYEKSKNNEISSDSNANPENSTAWFVDYLLERVISDFFMALFMCGLLRICDKLSNPFKQNASTSFPEDIIIYSLAGECAALSKGTESFDSICPFILRSRKSTSPIIAHFNRPRKNVNINPLPSQNEHEKEKIQSLSSEALGQFLQNHGEGLNIYAEVFVAKNINGYVFSTLSDKELEEDLCISNKFHRRALLFLARSACTTVTL